MSSDLVTNSFLQLLEQCQSPNKVTRESSEQQLLSEVHNNPNLIFESLLMVIISAKATNEAKLFSLLTTRKLITMYWSDSMPSFNGEKLITDENLKENIKTTLLNIAVSAQNTDHRIVNCARYVVVQIASCDFPDSWPNMIQEILALMKDDNENNIFNGLALLTEIFEDVMTDDMFFVNDIGNLIFNAIVKYMTLYEKIEILEQLLKLYASCISMLTASQVFIDYEDMVIAQLSGLNNTVIHKFNSGTISVEADAFKLWKTYFELVQLLRINVSKSISKENKPIIKNQLLFHFQNAANVFSLDPDTYFESVEFVDYVIVIISLISMFLKSFNDCIVLICDCLFTLNKLSPMKKQELLDLNDVLEDLFGQDLNPNSFTIRDQIETFFYNIQQQNKNLSKQFQNELVKNVLNNLNKGDDIENCISLLHNCVDADSAHESSFAIVCNLYENISQLDPLTLIRLNFFAPKVIEKDGALLKSIVELLAQKSATDDYSKLSFLIFVYKLASDVQLPQSTLNGYLNQIVLSLDSDKMYPMLEILSKLSSNDHNDELIKLNQFASLVTIITTNSQDLNNVLVYSLIDEILQNIFAKASLNFFVEIANKYFNDLINSITAVDYDCDISSLKLPLKILSNYVTNFPKTSTLPLEIIKSLLEPLMKLIEQLLYVSGGEESDLLEESTLLLNNIVKNSDYENISTAVPQLLGILSHFLSTDNSCSKIGTLTLTILTKVGTTLSSDVLNDIIFKIIQLFVNDKNENNFKLSEDLIIIICYLAINNTTYFVDIVANLNVEVVKKLFDKWFDIFESVRGLFLIKCNIISLINIYNSNRFNELIVKGDVKTNEMWDQDRVITRSMSKKMKIEYHAISLDEKIQQVLINETLIQIRSGSFDDVESYGEQNDDDEESGDDDDWEDIDPELKYDQLNDLIKYSADDDNDDDEEYDDYESPDEDPYNQNFEGFQVSGKSILHILVQFLKMNVNTPCFRHIYDDKLDQSQKTDLANALI